MYIYGHVKRVLFLAKPSFWSSLTFGLLKVGLK